MKRFIGTISAALILLSIFSGDVTGQQVEELKMDKILAERIITVGGADADMPGYTSRAIQLAVNTLKTRNGGTVKLNPGRFEMKEPVRLYSHINLIGSGKQTVLHKSDGIKTRITNDAFSGMYHITVADPSGFETGTGIVIFDDVNKGCWQVTIAVVTAVEGNVIYIDTPLINNYWAAKNSAASNAFPIVKTVEAENVRITDFMVDGNGDKNDLITGCGAGGIDLLRSKNCVVENVHVAHYNGDSFSWQTTENITIRNCESSYGGGLGFHPGTVSDWTIVENCRSHHNKLDGIFLCYNVQNGIFRDNVLYANGRYGISIGHQDTDNLFFNNYVYENKKHGIYFRDETEENGGHRNTLRNNIVENNGCDSFEAFGFYIDGVTKDIVIENNIIRSTGKGNQIGAVCIGQDASNVTVENNNISGHPELKKEKRSEDKSS